MREVIEKIKKAESMAVFPHINEDADAMGSCFAFAAMMRKMGKKAVVYTNGGIERALEFIGGGYVVYEKGMKHDHDLCVCLDSGDIDRIGERRALLEEIGNSVNIDHHFTNTLYADTNYVDGKASATGEILTNMFSVMGESLDDEIARYLYIAICSDTGCFKYSSVTPKTLRTAADLLEYDFDHAEAARLLFDTESLAAAKLKAEVTGQIKSFADGKIKLVTADESIGEKYGLDAKNIPNLVEIPRRIEGTEIAVCLKKANGAYRVNLRSNGEADVARVAIALGGGGHVKAAGATVRYATDEEAQTAVIAECMKALDEI